LPRLRDDQLIELVIVAGWYRLLSCVINTLWIELEPWAARFPQGKHNEVRLPY
jgi:4-carboxymuconolactone decarboxylase